MPLTLSDEIWKGVWNSLDLATSSRGAFTTLSLSTTGLDHRPKSRTIILRQVNKENGVIRFATDLRSRKIEEINAQPYVALTGYDGNESVQIRLEGRAYINLSPEQTKSFFNTLKPHTHYLFTSNERPGSKISRPDDVQFAKESDRTSDIAFQNFGLVDIVLDAMEWLDLSKAPHHRLRFERTGEHWSHHWLVA